MPILYCKPAGGGATAYTKSVEYNGTDEYIDFGTAAPDILSNLSVSFWIKASDPGTRTAILGRVSLFGGNYSGWEIERWTVANNIAFNINQNAAGSIYKFGVTSDNPLDGSWHHIVGTFDSSGNLVYYKDGAVGTFGTYIGTGTSIRTTPSYPLTIAKPFPGPGGIFAYFAGKIVNVALFDTAVLALSDVQSLYNGGKIVDPTTLTYSGSQNLIFSALTSDGTDLESAGGVIDDVGGANGTAVNMTNATDLVDDVP